jgi:Zn-dependent protease
MFLQYLIKDPLYFVWWIGISVFSVCVHEFFHALAAYWQGDSTARDRGYFTLNPMVHMGIHSLIILFLMGMCWGACPVSVHKMRHAYSEALVAFAGPFANLLLTLLFALLGLGAAIAPPTLFSPALQSALISFFHLASLTNGTLFVLNMIPLPPLDGHAVLSYFLPPGLRKGFGPLEGMMFPILFLLLSMGLGGVLWTAGAMVSDSCFALGSLALGHFL